MSDEGKKRQSDRVRCTDLTDYTDYTDSTDSTTNQSCISRAHGNAYKPG